MKKIMTIICVTAMLFMFAGCTGTDDTGTGTNNGTGNAVTDTTDKIGDDIENGIDNVEDGIDDMMDGTEGDTGNKDNTGSADGESTTK